MLRSKGFRLLGLLFAFTLIAAACGDDDDDDGGGDGDGDGGDTSVGLVYDVGGRGDQSFNDAAAAGLDQAATDLGVATTDLEPDEGGENRGELLRLLSEDGNDLVIGVGFAFADSMGGVADDEEDNGVAGDFPDTNYAIIDSVVDQPNVASLTFAEEQGSFLVGAAAALKSETDSIGFIGGVENDLIKKFEAGFVAGAEQINPDIAVEVQYISPAGDFSGFSDPARAQEIASAMYEGGADVVYHAAGGSGAGLFNAAKDYSEANTQVWAIGVDSDQYLTAGEEFQPYILTSMLKAVDVAVYNTIDSQVDGSFASGPQVFDLSVDGVGYSTSGGYLDDISSDLDDLKAQIVDGTIEVPATP